MKRAISILLWAYYLSSGLVQATDNCVEREEWYLWTEDDVRHYITEVGEGKPVIVLHGGFGAEHSYLLDAVAPLAGSYRFILYDQRGSLRSPAPENSITIARLVADLEALRQELKLKKITILGHSNGSTLAYDYLAAHADKVRGLVLTGPVPPEEPGTEPKPYKSARERWNNTVDDHVTAELKAEGLQRDPDNSRERTYRWRIQFAARNIYHIGKWRQVEGGQAFYTPRTWEALQANEPEGYWENRSRRAHKALRSFDGPVNVILGTFDYSDPGANIWPQLAEELSDGQLTVLEKAGHLPWIDQPVAFSAELRNALRDATSHH